MTRHLEVKSRKVSSNILRRNGEEGIICNAYLLLERILTCKTALGMRSIRASYNEYSGNGESIRLNYWEMIRKMVWGKIVKSLKNVAVTSFQKQWKTIK